MKKNTLGVELLDERIVMTAGLRGVVETEETKVVFSGGWGMAQYQYGFEGTYHNTNTQPVGSLKGTGESEESAIVFVGGYGAASYQYANETTYDAIDAALADDLVF